jgi:hypothetical protein
MIFSIKAVLEFILLTVYFGWGVYSLRKRYGRHEEVSLTTECLTLLGLVFFLMFQLSLLRTLMPHYMVHCIFAMLGLTVSSAALYAPTAISLASRIVVDVMVHSEDSRVDEPRFGPALALERQGDYESALQEYLVLARIYPTNANVHTHIAEVQLALSRPEEAVVWYERALKHLDTPKQNSLIVNRLCELYEHTLGDIDLAQEVLRTFVKRFPDAANVSTMQRRLEHIGQESTHVHSDALELLEETPLESEDEDAIISQGEFKKVPEEGDTSQLGARPSSAVKSIDAPLTPETLPPPVEESHQEQSALEPLTSPITSPLEETEPEPPHTTSVKIGIEAVNSDLEDIPEEDDINPPKAMWSDGLEALDDAPLPSEEHEDT